MSRKIRNTEAKKAAKYNTDMEVIRTVTVGTQAQPRVVTLEQKYCTILNPSDNDIQT